MQSLPAQEIVTPPAVHLEASFLPLDRVLKSLFAVHPQPMWLYCAATQRVVAANSAAETFYGASADTLYGMHVSDLLMSRRRMRAASGESAMAALHWNCEHGPRWARTDIISVQVAERLVNLVVVTPTPVEDAVVRGGDAGAFFSRFFLCSPVAVVLVDLDHRAVDANLEFQRQFERTSGEIRDREIVTAIIGSRPDARWRHGGDDPLAGPLTAWALVRQRRRVPFAELYPTLPAYRRR